MSGVISEWRNQAELIEALRERVKRLNTTFAAVDELAGLPTGYCSKVLGPRPVKNIGRMSLESILGALAVKGALVDDEDQMKRIQGRIYKRTHVGATQDNSTITLHLSRRHFRTIGKLGGKARRPRGKREMKRLAKAGGQARMAKLTPEQRSALARAAVNRRWATSRAGTTAGMQITGETCQNGA